MFVCVCNVISDKEIKKAIEAGHDEPEAIYAACGCQQQCGSCIETMEEMIFDHKLSQVTAQSGPIVASLPMVAKPTE